MTTIWVRVIYRPRGIQSTMWVYGWIFASDTMSRAWDTLRRVGDWRKWEYRAEMVHPGDFDHPKNREVLGKRDPTASILVQSLLVAAASRVNGHACLGAPQHGALVDPRSGSC